MWRRFAKLLCCPICKETVELRSLKENSLPISVEAKRLAEERNVFDSDFNLYVESGLLLCHRCRKWFPITRGLPILIPYLTPLHEEFMNHFKEWLSDLDVKYDFPTEEPVSGEKFVMTSFSKEWLDYEYDGVIWGMDYGDHEKRFLAELGDNHRSEYKKAFLEIGCGLGITTFMAYKNFEVDAIGVDLSLAVLRGTQNYKENPFVHFVQASAFYLPFKPGIADIVYSHGVLHHTYSTYEAVKTIAPCCSPGGLFYLWVYGTGSTEENLFRRIAYVVESKFRPILSENPSSVFAKGFLNMAAGVYVLVNAIHRLRNPRVQRYNLQRAVHAARDRFTPLYAHRQDYQEVAGWFQEVGFEGIEEVAWDCMPIADQENYKRNTGVRGRKKNGNP